MVNVSKPTPAIGRVLGRITKEDRGFATECWCWQGSLGVGGYGQVAEKGKVKRTHRVVYEAFRGPIPADLTIDHLCRVRTCCNPDHLEVVSREENSRRGWIGTRSSPHRKRDRGTHCVRGHSFAEHYVLFSNGKGRCRLCDNIRHAAWYGRKKAQKVGPRHIGEGA